jgi:hypothetical protein
VGASPLEDEAGGGEGVVLGEVNGPPLAKNARNKHPALSARLRKFYNPAMSASSKAALVLVWAVALAFVVWRFMLPLAAQYLAGVGVEIPLPKRFVMAYPKLSVYLFVFGGPVLFLAFMVTLIWLLRLRTRLR